MQPVSVGTIFSFCKDYVWINAVMERHIRPNVTTVISSVEMDAPLIAWLRLTILAKMSL